MANPEHIAILEKGVEVWNNWRAENPGVDVDLCEVNLNETNLCGVYFAGANLDRGQLKGANLEGAELRWVHFEQADLSEANLREAYLYEAHLRDARLNGASLCEAYLEGANLEGADLERVDLRAAYLQRTNLSRAHLRWVHLDAAIFNETIFADTCIREAKGLESCVHYGASSIDLNTLRQSWPLPQDFLRGCGLAGDYIECLSSLLLQPAQYYSCFISYNSHDQKFAQRLRADLHDRGVDCWYAPEDMRTGARIRPSIHEAILQCDKLLVILSQHSITSDWVADEVESAMAREEDGSTVVFPVRIDNAVMDVSSGWAASVGRGRHIGDFCAWENPDGYRQTFERLLRDLELPEDG